MAEVEIEHEEDNKLMNRRELRLKVGHEGEGTPSREGLAGEVAGLVDASRGNIVIAEIDTEYGMEESIVDVRVYDDKESLEKYERDYFQERG